MPIYDFRCLECSTVSEILLRDSEHVACCPSCGSDNMEKLFSASYVIKTETANPGTTCCGRSERCETPSCSTGGTCRRG